MDINISEDKSYRFKQINLKFENNPYSNIFGLKNNRTVQETIEHKRYNKFKDEVYSNYSNCLMMPLGEFLLNLKHDRDNFYKLFLNKYGDLQYSTFSIIDGSSLNKKGIYAYFSGDKLKYIGRCRDSMKKRVNQGYGKITPKNCYIDGQATNCHLNSLICSATESISLYIYEMTSNHKIEELETQLIKYNQPQWNIQKS